MRWTITIVFVVMLLSGCRTGIELTADLLPADETYEQSSGGPGKTNATPDPIQLPLVQRWQTSLSGPSGAHAVTVSGTTFVIPTLLEGLDIIDALSGEERGWVTTDGAVLGAPATVDSMLIVPITGGPTALKAIDIYTNKPRWAAAGEPVENPVLALGQRLFITGMFGTVSCYGTTDSSSIWKRKLPEPILCGASGTDSLVFIGCTNGDVYALTCTTGDIRWRFSTGDAIHATPVTDGNHVFAANRSGRFVALDARSGSLLWEVTRDAPLFASPAVDAGLLVLPASDGEIVAYDPVTGETKWALTLGTVPSGSPLLTPGHVVLAGMDGRLVVADRSTGKILWSETIEGRIRTSPVYCNGVICVITDSGEMYGYTHATK